MRFKEVDMTDAFFYLRRAQYHETDQMGIIHHANYVKWMEEARIAFLDSAGVSYKAMEEAGIVSPVVRVSVDYKNSIYFDDEIRVFVRAEKYNGIRLCVRYEFRRAADDTLCAEASSEHCFLKDGRLVSLKKEMPKVDAALG